MMQIPWDFWRDPLRVAVNPRMAKDSVGIGAAVGTRNGKLPLPNLSGDLATIADLFDRIPGMNGGTADTAGSWPVERAALIADVTRQIAAFQSANRSLTQDSAIDPGGATLRLMNQFAKEPPLTASVDPRPGDNGWEDMSSLTSYASVASMPGTAALVPESRSTAYSRRLIKVTASSIKWFGVVVPNSVKNAAATAVPLVFFTPTPAQGNYYDNSYENFTGWTQLWDDYTSRIGGLMTAAGVQQILVLPFYKNSQAYALGSFLNDWQDVISAVVTAAINDIDPYCLRDTFTFNRIYSASFSNGVNVHRQFNSHGTGVKGMTSRIFDLDGVAQTGGSDWRPSNGIIYQNRGAAGGVNPQGSNWYVGGRWALFDNIQPQTSRYSHHACSQFLLFHGLRQFCN